MSSGPLPVIAVTAQGRPQASVAALGRPVVASVTVPGQQGAQGNEGPVGPQGVPGDYGYIRFDEAGVVSYQLLPAVDFPFSLIAPITISDTLRPPFAGVAFLAADGKTVRARKAGDSYFVRIRLSVVPTMASGTFEVNLFVTGNTTGITGASSTRPRIIPVSAGQTSRIDELFQVFPGAGFAANGALFMLRCSVAATVSPESLFITPAVAAA